MVPIVLIATIPPLFRGPSPRPGLSGPEQTQDVAGFRIHYTVEGDDAIDPDVYLPQIVRGLAEGLAIYEAEGWPAPRPDNGEGGSEAIDVYIVDVDVRGYANPVEGDGGTSCYIRIDPEIPTSEDSVASVARHELHHCIQFGYRIDLPTWLYESTATYQQYAHTDDPVLDAAVGTLWTSRLAFPERRLGDDRDPYATFLWSKFWTEYQGYNPGRLVALWEALATDETWPVAMDAAAQEAFGESLSDVFVQYALHNRFACANDDGRHYLDGPVPCVAPLATVPSRPFDGQVRIRHDERRFTAAYFDVPAADEDGPLGIHCSGAEGTRAALVSVDEAGARAATAVEDPRSGALWVVRTAGEAARLVVAGTDATLDATCTEVEPATPTGCKTAPVTVSGLGLALLGGLLRRRRTDGGPR